MLNLKTMSSVPIWGEGGLNHYIAVNIFYLEVSLFISLWTWQVKSLDIDYYCPLLILRVIWALITFKTHEKDFTFVAQYVSVRVVVGYRVIKSKDFCMIK